MNITINYATLSGHSKKIANALAAHFGVTANDVKETKNFDKTDLAVIVSGVYSAQPMPEMQELVANIDKSKVSKLLFITSSVTMQGTPLADIAKTKGFDIAGEYIVKGGFLIISFTHPNKADIKNVIDYVENILQQQ